MPARNCQISLDFRNSPSPLADWLARAVVLLAVGAFLLVIAHGERRRREAAATLSGWIRSDP